MKAIHLIIPALLCLFVVSASAQTEPGSLRGIVTDAQTGEPLLGASVVVKDDGGNIIKGATTDLDGKYNINPLNPGTYTVECSFLGYATLKITDLVIDPNVTTTRNFKLRPPTEVLSEVVISYDIIPSEESIRTASPVTTKRKSEYSVSDQTNVRGARSEGTVYFINGVKVSGTVYHYYYQDNTEEYETITENRFLDAASNPLSTFSSDVDVASYSNLRRFISNGELPPVDAVRIEEMINYFNYDYPAPAKGKTFSVTTETVACDWAPTHQLLRIGIQTEKIALEELPPNNLVFLLDVSGSMDSPYKLPLLKKSLKLLVHTLRKEDRVAIVVYASATGLVLPSTPGDEKEKILEAIDRLNAGGSTAGGAGIQLAYKTAIENFEKKANSRVILATDGDFNVGISSDDELVKLIEEKREAGVFLSVLGFGTDNYKDSKMEKLADNGNGNYAYIDNLFEAKKVLVNELGANLNVVAKDTKFQIEFNPARVQAYRLIGYENRLLNDEDFNDDTKDAGDIGSGHSVTAIYEIIPTGVKIDRILANVDSLKYQINRSPAGKFDNEIATVKIRHKKPGEEKSILETHTVKKESKAVSEDLKFISAVIEFGLLLRDSEYKGNSSYEKVLALAKSGKGEDEGGYRHEFIRLVSLAKDLHEQNTALLEDD